MAGIKLNKTLYGFIKPFFLTLCFFSVFKGIFEAVFNTLIFEYFDEVIFFIAIIVLSQTFLFKKNLAIIYFIIAVFLSYSVTISLIFGVSGNVLTVVAQSLITIKFFIILLAMIELFKNDFQKLNRFYMYIISFAVLGLLIHLSFGEKFNHWVNISTFARPTLRYVGFFTHPNHLAYLFVLYIAYILNDKYFKHAKLNIRDWLKILLGVFVIIFLADSRTAIIAVAVLLFAFYWSLIRKNIKLIFSVFLITVLCFMYLYFYTSLIDSIIENIGDTLNLESHYVRGNMIYMSGLIFLDFFPIGTGAATFGSVLSDNKVYDLYGQADRFYFVNEIGIYDSNIASLIGEYGFIGIVLFSAMFIYLLKYLKSFTCFRTLISPFIVIFLVYAITNPMLTNNVYTILSALILAIFALRTSSTKSTK